MIDPIDILKIATDKAWTASVVLHACRHANDTVEACAALWAAQFEYGEAMTDIGRVHNVIRLMTDTPDP